ncbi:MAG: hypothetical protein ABS43_20230 [Bordetella sp. SCN 67-23]|nr:LysR family transcriptional regulator [Burkholderiales bacterium]ODS71671.1 MAG: hypothetical protein ABS43_20230 [Bordetella sp. SCN 67-23]OJW87383.1 MAG: hypothetical protein BGO71_28740 [Burkholderiales bacterium 67-32]
MTEPTLPSGGRLLRRAHLLGDFLAVADAGGIRPAADRLHISQSALTRRIQDLEDDLGVALFERSPAGMRLTAFGHALLHHARIIDVTCAYAASEIGDLLGGGAGELRIAAGPAWGYVAVPDAIAAVQRRFPRVRVELVNRMNEFTLPMLASGRLDAVLGGLPERRQRDPELVYEELLDIHYLIFAGRQHPLHAAEQVGPGEVGREAWIGFNEAVTGRAFFSAWFEQANVTPPISSFETQSVQSGFRLMQRGNYLMLLPSTLISLAQEYGIAPLRSGPPIGSYVSGMMYRASALRLRAFAAFREEVLRLTAA